MNGKTNKRREYNDIEAGQSEGNNNMALKANPKPARMANLELLRCIAMMMVVVLHYLGKGGMLSELTGGAVSKAEKAAWLLESFCIVAVNVYMLISGYFLCTSSFRVSRLIQLWLQIWAYSVVFGLMGALTGVLQETAFDTHYLLTLLFPVTMGHYWFMTAYVFLYLLLPFVGMAVRDMTKRQMQAALGILLVVFCVSKSVLPIRLEMDGQGYDCLWYLCVFLAAAYVRRFGVPFLERKGRGLLLYAGGCLLIFAGTFALREVYLHTGGLDSRIKMCLEYNHILPFLAALGLFGAFCRCKVPAKAAGIVNRIAPYTLGVYLLHENLGLRYTWQKWLGAESLAAAVGNVDSGIGAVGSLLVWTAAAVLAVFCCGILVDVVRKGIFDGVHKVGRKMGWYRQLTAAIERADALFRQK